MFNIHKYLHPHTILHFRYSVMILDHGTSWCVSAERRNSNITVDRTNGSAKNTNSCRKQAQKAIMEYERNHTKNDEDTAVTYRVATVSDAIDLIPHGVLKFTAAATAVIVIIAFIIAMIIGYAGTVL